MLTGLKFTGECVRTLDAKNRIAMPPKYKDALGDQPFYVTCFPDENRLRIYNEEDLDSILNENLYTNDGDDRSMLQTYIFSRTEKCDLDTHSRFTISKTLCALAGIDKEVKMVGTGKRIELWCPSVYDETMRNYKAPRFIAPF